MTSPVRPHVGFIVDGDAEFRSLKALLGAANTERQLVEVLRGDLQPHAPFGTNAKAIGSSLVVLASQDIRHVVVLIDRETLALCPSAMRVGLLAAITRECNALAFDSIEVVVKDRCFENWLLGDVDCVVKMRKRFKLTTATERAIREGRVDTLDAQKLLKQAAIGKSYTKILDAMMICRKADALAMARASRSFRRLLRVIRHESYLTQSKKPAA